MKLYKLEDTDESDESATDDQALDEPTIKIL